MAYILCLQGLWCWLLPRPRCPHPQCREHRRLHVLGSSGEPLAGPAQAAPSALPPQESRLLPRCPWCHFVPCDSSRQQQHAAPRQGPPHTQQLFPLLLNGHSHGCLLILGIEGTAELIKVYLAPRGLLHADPLPSTSPPPALPLPSSSSSPSPAQGPPAFPLHRPRRQQPGSFQLQLSRPR